MRLEEYKKQYLNLVRENKSMVRYYGFVLALAVLAIMYSALNGHIIVSIISASFLLYMIVQSTRIIPHDKFEKTFKVKLTELEAGTISFDEFKKSIEKEREGIYLQNPNT